MASQTTLIISIVCATTGLVAIGITIVACIYISKQKRKLHAVGDRPLDVIDSPSSNEVNLQQIKEQVDKSEKSQTIDPQKQNSEHLTIERESYPTFVNLFTVGAGNESKSTKSADDVSRSKSMKTPPPSRNPNDELKSTDKDQGPNVAWQDKEHVLDKQETYPKFVSLFTVGNENVCQTTKSESKKEKAQRSKSMKNIPVSKGGKPKQNVTLSRNETVSIPVKHTGTETSSLKDRSDSLVNTFIIGPNIAASRCWEDLSTELANLNNLECSDDTDSDNTKKDLKPSRKTKEILSDTSMSDNTSYKGYQVDQTVGLQKKKENTLNDLESDRLESEDSEPEENQTQEKHKSYDIETKVIPFDPPKRDSPSPTLTEVEESSIKRPQTPHPLTGNKHDKVSTLYRCKSMPSNSRTTYTPTHKHGFETGDDHPNSDLDNDLCAIKNKKSAHKTLPFENKDVNVNAVHKSTTSHNENEGNSDLGITDVDGDELDIINEQVEVGSTENDKVKQTNLYTHIENGEKQVGITTSDMHCTNISTVPDCRIDLSEESIKKEPAQETTTDNVDIKSSHLDSLVTPQEDAVTTVNTISGFFVTMENNRNMSTSTLERDDTFYGNGRSAPVRDIGQKYEENTFGDVKDPFEEELASSNMPSNPIVRSLSQTSEELSSLASSRKRKHPILRAATPIPTTDAKPKKGILKKNTGRQHRLEIRLPDESSETIEERDEVVSESPRDASQERISIDELQETYIEFCQQDHLRNSQLTNAFEADAQSDDVNQDSKTSKHSLEKYNELNNDHSELQLNQDLHADVHIKSTCNALIREVESRSRKEPGLLKAKAPSVDSNVVYTDDNKNLQQHQCFSPITATRGLKEQPITGFNEDTEIGVSDFNTGIEMEQVENLETLTNISDSESYVDEQNGRKVKCKETKEELQEELSPNVARGLVKNTEQHKRMTLNTNIASTLNSQESLEIPDIIHLSENTKTEVLPCHAEISGDDESQLLASNNFPRIRNTQGLNVTQDSNDDCENTGLKPGAYTRNAIENEETHSDKSASDKDIYQRKDQKQEGNVNPPVTHSKANVEDLDNKELKTNDNDLSGYENSPVTTTGIGQKPKSSAGESTSIINGITQKTSKQGFAVLSDIDHLGIRLDTDKMPSSERKSSTTIASIKENESNKAKKTKAKLRSKSMAAYRTSQNGGKTFNTRRRVSYRETKYDPKAAEAFKINPISVNSSFSTESPCVDNRTNHTAPDVPSNSTSKIHLASEINDQPNLDGEVASITVNKIHTDVAVTDDGHIDTLAIEIVGQANPSRRPKPSKGRSRSVNNLDMVKHETEISNNSYATQSLSIPVPSLSKDSRIDYKPVRPKDQVKRSISARFRSRVKGTYEVTDDGYTMNPGFTPASSPVNIGIHESHGREDAKLGISQKSAENQQIVENNGLIKDRVTSYHLVDTPPQVGTSVMSGNTADNKGSFNRGSRPKSAKVRQRPQSVTFPMHKNETYEYSDKNGQLQAGPQSVQLYTGLKRNETFQHTKMVRRRDKIRSKSVIIPETKIEKPSTTKGRKTPNIYRTVENQSFLINRSRYDHETIDSTLQNAEPFKQQIGIEDSQTNLSINADLDRQVAESRKSRTQDSAMSKDARFHRGRPRSSYGRSRTQEIVLNNVNGTTLERPQSSYGRSRTPKGSFIDEEKGPTLERPQSSYGRARTPQEFVMNEDKGPCLERPQSSNRRSRTPQEFVMDRETQNQLEIVMNEENGPSLERPQSSHGRSRTAQKFVRKDEKGTRLYRPQSSYGRSRTQEIIINEHKGATIERPQSSYGRSRTAQEIVMNKEQYPTIERPQSSHGRSMKHDTSMAVETQPERPNSSHEISRSQDTDVFKEQRLQIERPKSSYGTSRVRTFNESKYGINNRRQTSASDLVASRRSRNIVRRPKQKTNTLTNDNTDDTLSETDASSDGAEVSTILIANATSKMDFSFTKASTSPFQVNAHSAQQSFSSGHKNAWRESNQKENSNPFNSKKTVPIQDINREHFAPVYSRYFSQASTSPDMTGRAPRKNIKGSTHAGPTPTPGSELVPITHRIQDALSMNQRTTLPIGEQIMTVCHRDDANHALPTQYAEKLSGLSRSNTVGHGDKYQTRNQEMTKRKYDVKGRLNRSQTVRHDARYQAGYKSVITQLGDSKTTSLPISNSLNPADKHSEDNRNVLAQPRDNKYKLSRSHTVGPADKYTASYRSAMDQAAKFVDPFKRPQTPSVIDMETGPRNVSISPGLMKTAEKLRSRNRFSNNMRSKSTIPF